MDPTTLITALSPKTQGYVFLAFLAFQALNMLSAKLHAMFPQNKTLGVINHWFAAVGPRLPATLTPPQQQAALEALHTAIEDAGAAGVSVSTLIHAPVLTVTPAPPPASPAPAPAAPTASGGADPGPLKNPGGFAVWPLLWILPLASIWYVLRAAWGVYRRSTTYLWPIGVRPPWLVLGLALAILGGTTACAHMTPLEGKLLSCGEQGGASVISAEGPIAINAALSSTDPQWQTAPILAAGLDTTICAIVAIFNSLTQPTASGALPALTPADQVRLIHARALLLQWGVVNANGQVRRGVVAPK